MTRTDVEKWKYRVEFFRQLPSGDWVAVKAKYTETLEAAQSLPEPGYVRTLRRIFELVETINPR